MTEMNFGILPIEKSVLKQILELQKECYQTEAAWYNDYNIPPLAQTYHSINQEFEEGILFLKGIVNGKIVGSVRGEIKRILLL